MSVDISNIQKVYLDEDSHMLVISFAHGIDIRIPVSLSNITKVKKGLKYLKEEHDENKQRYLTELAIENLKIIGVVKDDNS